MVCLLFKQQPQQRRFDDNSVGWRTGRCATYDRIDIVYFHCYYFYVRGDSATWTKSRHKSCTLEAGGHWVS